MSSHKLVDWRQLLANMFFVNFTVDEGTYALFPGFFERRHHDEDREEECKADHHLIGREFAGFPLLFLETTEPPRCA